MNNVNLERVSQYIIHKIFNKNINTKLTRPTKNLITTPTLGTNVLERPCCAFIALLLTYAFYVTR